jgi:hypothetical protein
LRSPEFEESRVRGKAAVNTHAVQTLREIVERFTVREASGLRWL